METKSIKQTATFNASPDKVYNLIMDAKKHAAFSGAEASVSTKVNGKFSVYDGYCTGYNIELIPGKKIVQAWHFAEDGWPDDHFSTCTFLFKAQGEKTKLSFTQINVPEHKSEALKKGWQAYYWDLMKAYLKNKKTPTMKKYFLIGGITTFVIIFNLGYVFHEIAMGDFFEEHMSSIQRDAYIIPLIALVFILYVAFQAYFLPIYFDYTSEKYHWSLTKTSIVFGALIGFFWDGLQGGLIEVASLKMPIIVFLYDSTYHTLEGILTALLLAAFYRKFELNTIKVNR